MREYNAMKDSRVPRREDIRIEKEQQYSEITKVVKIAEIQYYS